MGDTGAAARYLITREGSAALINNFMKLACAACTLLIAVAAASPTADTVVPEENLVETQGFFGDVEHWFDDEVDWFEDEAEDVKPPSHGACYDKLDFRIESEIFKGIQEKTQGVNVPKAGYDAAHAVIAPMVEEKLAKSKPPLNKHCKELISQCMTHPMVFAACESSCTGGLCDGHPPFPVHAGSAQGSAAMA